ncbi:hypothetical protein DXU04_17995 [Bradyrhizobium diazoefficiens]
MPSSRSARRSSPGGDEPKTSMPGSCPGIASLENRFAASGETTASERAVQTAGLILGVPFRAGAAHVVQLGAVGVAGDPDQRQPFGGNEVQGLAEQAQGRDQHGITSMRLAEHGGEGEVENLLAVVAADMDHPVAPVFRTGRQDHRTHDLGGAVACLGQIGYRRAVPIDQRAFGIRAVEIHLNHTRLL